MSDLFIQKSAYFLGLSNQKIIIKNSQREIEREVSIYLVDNLLIFGQAQISTQLLKASARENINVYYFSSEGKFLACLDSYRQEDFDKQEKQVRACLDQDFCLALSKEIVSAKVKYQLSLLKSYNQDGILSVDDFGRFHLTLQKIKEAESISQIMGYEGRIAKSYFYYLSLLVPDSFRFYGRRRQPCYGFFQLFTKFWLFHSLLLLLEFDTEKWLKLWIWCPTSELWSSRLSCERFDGGVETCHCRQYYHAIDFGREFKR